MVILLDSRSVYVAVSCSTAPKTYSTLLTTEMGKYSLVLLTGVRKATITIAGFPFSLCSSVM